MSGTDALDLIDDPSWLEEPLCGLPEENEEKSLLALVPYLSAWVNSSASTNTGKLIDTVVQGGGSFLLGKGLGAILHVPFVGSGVDWLVSKALKKGAGIDFSLKNSVTYGTRRIAMAAEGFLTGKRQGAAVLKAQTLMGNLGDVGKAISK